MILRTFVAPEVQLHQYRIDSAELCKRLLFDLRCMATGKGIFREICGRPLCASVNSLAQFPEHADGDLNFIWTWLVHRSVSSDALVALERYANLKPVELERIRRQDPNLA